MYAARSYHRKNTGSEPVTEWTSRYLTITLLCFSGMIRIFTANNSLS